MGSEGLESVYAAWGCLHKILGSLSDTETDTQYHHKDLLIKFSSVFVEHIIVDQH